MEWILTRQAVIVLAILGAAASIAASTLRTRNAVHARQVNLIGYALMGLSMLLFVIVGFRAH